MSERARAAALALALALGGCADEVRGLHDLRVLEASAEPSLDFYALPYPNDLRRDEDGTSSLAGYLRKEGVLAQYVDLFDRASGFGTNEGAYLRFSAPLDPSTLPAIYGRRSSTGTSITTGASPRTTVNLTVVPRRLKNAPMAASFSTSVGRSFTATTRSPSSRSRSTCVCA